MTDPCLICDGASHTFMHRKNGFDLYRCDGCGLVVVHPPPSAAQLESYYHQGYNQFRYSFHNPMSDPPKSKTAELKILERFCAPGKILDVGAGHGHFLANAKRFGWEVSGVEPQEEARILAESRFRVEIFPALDDAPLSSYHAATLWHVIEHITGPKEFLLRVRDRLAADGVLAIATPNVKSLVAKATGWSWGWLSPPDHVVLYSPSTLPALLTQLGFEVLHVETRRGESRNFVILMLQALAYRLGLFGTLKRSVQKAAYEYQTGRTVARRVGMLLMVERVTNVLSYLLYPILIPLWKLGLGDELLVVVRKKGPA